MIDWMRVSTRAAGQFLWCRDGVSFWRAGGEHGMECMAARRDRDLIITVPRLAHFCEGVRVEVYRDFFLFRYRWRLLLSRYVNSADGAYSHPHGKQAAFFGIVVTTGAKAGGKLYDAYRFLSRPYSGTVDIFTTPDSQFGNGDELWIQGTPDASSDGANHRQCSCRECA